MEHIRITRRSRIMVLTQIGNELIAGAVVAEKLRKGNG